MIDSETLGHIEAIRQLKARYFRTIDTKDWEGYANVFTDDAQLDVSDDVAIASALAAKAWNEPLLIPQLAGGQKISDFVRAGLAGARTVHHGHTAEIEVLADGEATGVWAMTDIVEQAESLLRGAGHYHERYRMIDGQWRIASLRLTRLRVVVYRPDGEGGWRIVPIPRTAADLPAAIKPLARSAAA